MVDLLFANKTYSHLNIYTKVNEDFVKVGTIDRNDSVTIPSESNDLWLMFISMPNDKDDGNIRGSSLLIMSEDDMVECQKFVVFEANDQGVIDIAKESEYYDCN